MADKSEQEEKRPSFLNTFRQSLRDDGWIPIDDPRFPRGLMPPTGPKRMEYARARKAALLKEHKDYE